MQMAQRQPQHGETIDDLVKNEMKLDGDEDDATVEFTITPQMTNQFGAISYGALTTLLVEAGSTALKRTKRGDSVVENMTIYFMKPVQMEKTIQVVPKILDMSRRFVKVDFEVYSDDVLVCKALVTFQVLER